MAENPLTEPVIIWGAGAIGGTIGAYWARAGVPVPLVDRAADHVEACRTQGLRIGGRSRPSHKSSHGLQTTRAGRPRPIRASIVILRFTVARPKPMRRSGLSEILRGSRESRHLPSFISSPHP
jgi:hypothetical protein